MPITLASSSSLGSRPSSWVSPAFAHQSVDRFDHMHRDADGARLVGDCARDRLPYPPCRIGRELEALAVIELLDRADQADIAFLDEIEQL